MDYDIIRSKNENKHAYNKPNGIHVPFEARYAPINDESLYEEIDAYKRYLNERGASNLFRISFSIETVCSNILFNNITEIVKDEGSSGVKVLNYSGNVSFPYEDVYGGKTDKWCQREAIKDTQLTSNKLGWDYHCGLDIFNNHIIRNRTYRSICSGTNVGEDFNTISDRMRDADGNTVPWFDLQIKDELETGNGYGLHMYGIDDIDTYEQSVDRNLMEQDGWFGFKNGSSMAVQIDDGNGSYTPFEINKVINSKSQTSFIEMYPDSKLFSPVPLKNTFRRRVEHNWRYVLTYPFSSTTDVPFINSRVNSLKCVYFDECPPTLTNGTNRVYLYSSVRHGLSVGDYVSIYSTTYGDNGQVKDEKIYDTVKVVQVGDGTDDENKEFVFAVDFNGIKVGQLYVSELDFTGGKFNGVGGVSIKDMTQVAVQQQEERKRATKVTWTMSDDLKHVSGSNGEVRKVLNHRVILDSVLPELSFRRVANGDECDYYVRLFKALPNWEYAAVPINEETYQENIENGYNIPFENHIAQQSFAQNIYGDKIGSLVYTSDIDLSYLTDNLGRPLSDIYLTVVKTNYGYKEWYGKNSESEDVASDNVEFSHCFGAETMGFEMSYDSIFRPEFPNVRLFHNIHEDDDFEEVEDGNIRFSNCATPLDMEKIGGNVEDSVYEVDTKNGIVFYGDLCCLSKVLYIEESIDMACIRVNTAQRELKDGDFAYEVSESFDKDGSTPNFTRMAYDEILYDDYDSEYHPFEVKSYLVSKNCEAKESQRREGYYYKPHFRIPVRAIGNNVQYAFAPTVNMRSVYNVGEGYIGILTLGNHHIQDGSEFYICLHSDEISGSMFYRCTESVMKSPKNVVCKIERMDGEEIDFEEEFTREKVSEMAMFRKTPGIPSYAVFVDNGEYKYYWRTIENNGVDSMIDEEKVYPFTNGRFYVSENITLYLKRQDPHDKVVNYVRDNAYEIQPNCAPYSLEGVEIQTFENEYDGYKEETTC